jgi:hypothetical protein
MDRDPVLYFSNTCNLLKYNAFLPMPEIAYVRMKGQILFSIFKSDPKLPLNRQRSSSIKREIRKYLFDIFQA